MVDVAGTTLYQAKGQGVAISCVLWHEGGINLVLLSDSVDAGFGSPLVLNIIKSAVGVSQITPSFGLKHM